MASSSTGGNCSEDYGTFPDSAIAVHYRGSSSLPCFWHTSSIIIRRSLWRRGSAGSASPLVFWLLPRCSWAPINPLTKQTWQQKRPIFEPLFPHLRQDGQAKRSDQTSQSFLSLRQFRPIVMTFETSHSKPKWAHMFSSGNVSHLNAVYTNLNIVQYFVQEERLSKKNRTLRWTENAIPLPLWFTPFFFMRPYYNHGFVLSVYRQTARVLYTQSIFVYLAFASAKSQTYLQCYQVLQHADFEIRRIRA